MTRLKNQGSVAGPLLWALALAGLLLAVSLSAAGANSAHAQQGPVEDGGEIRFDQCYSISVTVDASDAAYTSVFWRFGPDANLGIDSKQVGETAVIGEVPANTELILGIVVSDLDGMTFQTGPASRNPDNRVHAIVNLNTLNVGFEDVPEGHEYEDWDYNDAVLNLTLEPCQEPEEFQLIVQVDPSSTGTGSTEGSGVYPAGSNQQAKAIPGPQSAFVSWSGDCAGGSPVDVVTMDSDKVCNALFKSVAPPEPSPTPEPTVTPEPPVIALPSTVGIDNTLVSLNPARVGETVTFRVDVALDVPAENVADVQYTFDDSELSYLNASASGVTFDNCQLASPGVIDCAFGVVSVDFSFDLNFEALTTADASTTNATLASDPDGAGPEAAIAAGPAAADVDIIDTPGSVPDTGDGSVTESGSTAFSLYALLGVTALATVAGVARKRGARS